jgi:hypothetical protein
MGTIKSRTFDALTRLAALRAVREHTPPPG